MIDSVMENTSVLGNVSSVPSPPTIPAMLQGGGTPHPFQSFQIGTSQLITQEPRVSVFKFSQPSYGYSLSQQQQQQIAQPAFTQANLFLPTTPTQHDTYGLHQLSSFPRNQQHPQHQQQPQHPFGQTPTQPNTIMVSSATSSLMSTSIKPPTQNTYGTSLQKNLGPSSLQFGQGLNSNSLQPSQISFIQYDPGQLFGTNQILSSTQTSQNVNTPSQILGSQLVQPRPAAVQNVQQVQGASSFFQQPPQQPIQQTSYFSQQGSSNLQLKSPPQSLTPTNNFGLPSSTLQSNATKPFNAAGQNRGGTNQRFNFNTNVHNPIQQFAAAAVAANQKFNNPFVGQPSLQNTASVVRPQLMMNNFRPNAPQIAPQQGGAPPQMNPQPTSASFPNPIQRPGGVQQISTAPRQQAPTFNPSHTASNISMSKPPPPPVTSLTVTPATAPTTSSTAGQSGFKALQAKQRQAVLAHTQNFLNPQNKPRVKQKAEASVISNNNIPQSSTQQPPSPASSSVSGNNKAVEEENNKTE